MMLPQVYHSSETSSCVSGADASAIKLPPAESSIDTVIAASSEDAPAATSQNALPGSGNKRVSVGYRPLILGTVRITTTSPAASSKSRLSSSSTSSARYRPTTPQARWSSYTSLLRPISSLATSSVSDEVASLKARLAESEAVAEDLIREKTKALSTSRQLFTGLENLRNQKVQWAKEKDELMERLRALDEDKATLVVSPPSEGVWLASSGEQQHVKQLKSHSASSKPFVDQTEGTQRPEGKGAMKVRLGSLDEAPRIPEIPVTPPETAPPSPPTSGSLRRHFLKWPRSPAGPPLSASLRQQHLKWPRVPANPLLPLGPRSTRWSSGAPQVDPSRRSLVDLGCQIAGTDPLSGSVARQVIDDRGKELLPLENAFAYTRPSINLATAGELEARMIRVSIDADRSRGTASAATREDPQIHIFPESFFASPSDIGGERRGFFKSLGRFGTPWRRSTLDRRLATAEQHATLESPRKRGLFGVFTSSSSPQGTTFEVAGDPQPRRKSRLRKLLKKGRCLISRIE